MKKIKLTNSNKFTLVDDEDYLGLNKYSWRIDQYGYVTNARRIDGETRTIFMSRYLTPWANKRDVDHINRDPLDNRKSNLRVATRSENNLNSKIRVNNTSGFKGVNFHKITRKWRAYIGHNGKIIYLGLYKSKAEAAFARRQKAKEIYGDFINE